MSETIRQLKKDNRTNAAKQADFLAAFCDLVSVSAACRKTKLPRCKVYDWLNADVDFKSKYEDACKIAMAALEDEAIRRAHEGTLKPVYQGGKKVGTIREYSDTLIIFLLKGLAPEKYKDRLYSEVTGKNGTPIQIINEVRSDIDYSKLSTTALKEIAAARNHKIE